MPPPWSQIVKQLDEEHTEKVYPMGDYRSNHKAMARKLDSLLGIQPKVAKEELLIREQRPSERPLTQQELWELKRQRAQQISEESHDIAFKRDEGAWADAEGYSQVKEMPAFRDGYNTTLRVKPSPEKDFGKSLPFRLNAQSEVIAKVTATDSIQRKMSKRSMFSQAVGALFMRGIQSGVIAKATQTANAGTREEIALLLRSLVTEEAPLGHKDTTSAEEARRKTVELSRELGNAFINLGLTLPAGKRDDPLRNDSVALKLGNTIMQSDSAGIRADAPSIEESLRKEVATAVGRAILHIRAAATIQANSILRPTADKEMRDRAFKTSVGRLTLQLLESSASRLKLEKLDPKRREVLANALGQLVQMEGTSLRKVSFERDREDKTVNTRQPATIGEAKFTREEPVIRQNKAGDRLVERPIVGVKSIM